MTQSTLGLVTFRLVALFQEEIRVWQKCYSDNAVRERASRSVSGRVRACVQRAHERPADPSVQQRASHLMNDQWRYQQHNKSLWPHTLGSSVTDNCGKFFINFMRGRLKKELATRVALTSEGEFKLFFSIKYKIQYIVTIFKVDLDCVLSLRNLETKNLITRL